MGKDFKKVDPKDVLVHWICDNKECDDYWTKTTTNPDCNEELVCDTCEHHLKFDSIEVARD